MEAFVVLVLANALGDLLADVIKWLNRKNGN
jgi:hypothetical protein